ncbi:sarcosine oxidase subunit gamma [Rhizobium wenxiniae]|uniref:sarcosine oxidase subunit gamma n=1 Tax=Rhizobium wenxiniae TaxID=1737357 RepID=UPI001C6E64AB|nr:sarcosine oxidase subunit gamma family protein [Rhizobium wenxiniae]MBW9086310.1 sarcosine oxidase subunit gamma [Rhizobium wenxiniae]
MSLTLFHRHVLEDYLAGFEAKANPNHLSVIRRPAIFSVLAHRGSEVLVEDGLKSIESIQLRNCAPGEWLVVSTTSGASTIENLLGEIAGASAVDQSDSRVLLQISGPNVRKILAKCVAVDLHADAFAIGASANMLCCHVAANLARTGADTFEITVPRSFAGSVFEEMMEMGREFALTAAFAD